MKITFLFNDNNWQSIDEKMSEIRAFFAPLDTPFTFDCVKTSLIGIPFVPVSIIGGIDNTAGTTTTVDPKWFETNISQFHPTSDIIMLCLSQNDVSASRTSIGIMQGKIGTSVQCCIFGINENDHAYVSGVDQGNSFVLFACHEISHALYLLQQKKDNTHAYFYTGQPAKVIPELQTNFSKLKTLLNYYIQLLSLYRQEQTIMNQKPQFSPLVVKWAGIIKQLEGAMPDSHNAGNLKYSSLTASWGATQGRAASDGGFLCQFKDDETGMTALCNFLTLGCENQLLAFHQARTLRDFTVIYAGNPPLGYINSIINLMGVSGDTEISTFIG